MRITITDTKVRNAETIIWQFGVYEIITFFHYDGREDEPKVSRMYVKDYYLNEDNMKPRPETQRLIMRCLRKKYRDYLNERRGRHG